MLTVIWINSRNYNPVINITINTYELQKQWNIKFKYVLEIQKIEKVSKTMDLKLLVQHVKKNLN